VVAITKCRTHLLVAQASSLILGTANCTRYDLLAGNSMFGEAIAKNVTCSNTLEQSEKFFS